MIEILRSPIAEEHFDFIQGRIKRHGWYSRTLDDSKVSLSIFLTTTPPACECLDIHQNMRIATLLSMVPVTLRNTVFYAFNSLIHYRQIHPGLGLVLDIDHSTKIFKYTALLKICYRVHWNSI